MRFRIAHRTCYRYSAPVFIDPHLLRLTPRGDGFQRLHECTLQITPPPAGQSMILDAEGNTVHTTWFDGLHEQLEIVADIHVETLRANPFDFLPHSQGEFLPLELPGAEGRHLAASLAHETEPLVQRLADDLAGQADYRTLMFLDALNKTLHAMVKVVVRDEGPARPAAETLARGDGACRDLVVLFMAACRAVGIPARFVSGYQAGDPVQDLRHLHAWTEVYVPGGGWRAYDPTLALAVADRHVTLVASADPAGAMPVAGAFRGDATCAMTIDLKMDRE